MTLYTKEIVDEPTQYISTYETQIIERLARMETKIDHISQTVVSHDARIVSLERNNPNPDHESRIRKLERAIWLAAGAGMAGGGVAGTIFSQVTGV